MEFELFVEAVIGGFHHQFPAEKPCFFISGTGVKDAAINVIRSKNVSGVKRIGEQLLENRKRSADQHFVDLYRLTSGRRYYP